MKWICSLMAAVMLVVLPVQAENEMPELVVVHSTDYGDTKNFLRFEELERMGNISKTRLTCRHMPSAVAYSMFAALGDYEIAKARGMEYFTELDGWKEPDGSFINLIGFTNTKDADIQTEFGGQYAPTNAYGQVRTYMSVSESGFVFEGMQKKAIGSLNPCVFYPPTAVSTP